MENQTNQKNKSSFKDKINSINDDVIKYQHEEKAKLVKEAEKDEESETIDFGKLLMDGIVKAAAKTGSIPDIVTATNGFINAKTKQDAVEPLINLIFKAVVNIVYNSIVLYDDLLKDEIQAQLDHIGKHINLSKSDIEALKAVVQIHSKDLSMIKDSLNMDKFKKEMGIK